MRRAIKNKVIGVLDDPRVSNTLQTLNNSRERQQMADRIVNFVREKSGAIIDTVQEHFTSMTDTTGTLAKQKLLQTLMSSGVIQSEHIRHALQIGIGHFLGGASNYPDTSCDHVDRVKFPAAGGPTPSHTLPDFDIEAYALATFGALLRIYGIDSQTLQSCICKDELKEVANPAKSGSLLYLTSDSAFIIKTVRDYEAKFIQNKFLAEYLQYVKHTPGTFIAKLFGVYGYVPYLSQQSNITVDSFTLRFAIFSNFIPSKLEIHEKYDLKGSSHGREADGNEKRKSSTTFKDNDFRQIHPHGFTLPKSVYHHLKNVLTRDVAFLEQLNVMDYSLLLTVHNIDNQVKPTCVGPLESFLGTVRDTFLAGVPPQIDENDKEQKPPKRVLRFHQPIETVGLGFKEISTYDTDNAKEFGGIPAVNEKGERLLLFFGIIDILQTFDICKVIQRQYQTVENRDVVDDRSIVEADFYARRFKEFVFERVFHPANDELATHPISMNVFSSSTHHQKAASSSYKTVESSSPSGLYPQIHHL